MPDPAWLWILAGPNGSGKSTLASAGALHRWVAHIPRKAQTPDDIARALPSIVPGADERAYVRAAQAASDALVEAAVDNRRTVMVETVGSSGKFFPLVDRAKTAGMRFGFIYVTVAFAALNLARVAQRVAEGGHDVPEALVLERRERSITNFAAFAQIADAGLVVDNSLGAADGHAATPRLLAERQPGGNWIVLDPRTAPYLTNQLVH